MLQTQQGQKPLSYNYYRRKQCKKAIAELPKFAKNVKDQVEPASRIGFKTSRGPDPRVGDCSLPPWVPCEAPGLEAQ
jgi:hypothetical protein